MRRRSEPGARGDLMIGHISGPRPRPRPRPRPQRLRKVPDTLGMSKFTHDRLDVYRAAIDFLVLADSIATSLPKGRAYIADHLRRASMSIPLNIAEGAGEFAPNDKARFYRIARCSGTECAAILHACEALKLVDPGPIEAARLVLERVVAMPTAMVRRIQDSDADADAGADADAPEKCD